MSKYLILLGLLGLGFAGPLKAQSAEKGDTLALAKKLAAGANPNAPDALGSTMLHTAARWGKTAEIRYLLNHGALVDSPRSPKGRTALMVASAYYATAEAVALLLDRGADVNARASDGTTALMLAAQMWKADIVKLLISHGANPSATDAKGRSAADYVRMNLVNEDVKKALGAFRISREECLQHLQP